MDGDGSSAESPSCNNKDNPGTIPPSKPESTSSSPPRSTHLPPPAGAVYRDYSTRTSPPYHQQRRMHEPQEVSEERYIQWADDAGPPPPPSPYVQYNGSRRGYPPVMDDDVPYYGGGRGAYYHQDDYSYDALLAEKQAVYRSGSAFQHHHAGDPYGYADHRRGTSGAYPPLNRSTGSGGSSSRNPKKKEETMVELEPGVFARLRGANETWHCIENDFHVPVVCFSCSLELCVIQDAAYVLCPKCRIVSPVDQMDSGHFAVNHVSPATATDGGVGLGFTFDDLFKWQAEIVKRRHAEMEQQQRRQYRNHLPPGYHPRPLPPQQRYHPGNGGGPGTYYY